MAALVKTESLAGQIAALSRNPRATSIAESNGVKIMNVTWEDCGRFKDSSVGPNISDMTLCVDKTNMPVIRKPNFNDITADLPLDTFMVKVGNEGTGGLKQITLREYLRDIKKYAGNDQIEDLLCDRDEQILTSSQACILPLNEGKVEFNVKLFNYQSSKEDPAVLVIIASNQGTSAQVITEYNQSLYFNKNGKAANFLAQRLTDHRKEVGSTNTGAMTEKEREMNELFIFQIPLEQKPRVSRGGYGGLECCFSMCEFISISMPMAMSMPKSASFKAFSAPPTRGIEDAILSTGEGHSDFKGTEGLKLKRDVRFPIRCTVQLYKVTDTIDIPTEVFKDVADNLAAVYDRANTKVPKGSLVVDGDTGRVTEPLLPSTYSVPSPYPVPEPYNPDTVPKPTICIMPKMLLPGDGYESYNPDTVPKPTICIMPMMLQPDDGYKQCCEGVLAEE